MIIDAHHHFWRYTPEEYGWIGEDMAAIRCDFGPVDLQREIAAAGVDGVVSVQARQAEAETAWLLQLADEHAFIRGVVGWVPLISPQVAASLECFTASPKLRGVRHVLQGELDDYMARDDFNRGIGQLHRFDLRYDILIHERQLPGAIALVDRHPQQVFILDHLAKPRIKAGEVEPWRMHIRDLAKRPHVYCKLSGMVTEADWSHWTPGQLQPYVDTVLDAFGPSRLMFGSDWPVCLVACGYSHWRHTVDSWIATLSPAEQARIMGGTAIEAYGLESSS